jgi:hypothetical protein
MKQKIEEISSDLLSQDAEKVIPTVSRVRASQSVLPVINNLPSRDHRERWFMEAFSAASSACERLFQDPVSVNQGTLFPVPLRLEQEGAVASDWSLSENNFYRLTRAGHKLLQAEKRDWDSRRRGRTRSGVGKSCG